VQILLHLKSQNLNVKSDVCVLTLLFIATYREREIKLSFQFYILFSIGWGEK